MKLKFPIHFQGRLLERSINVEHIRQAIKNPDSISDSFENRKIVIKSIDDKKIKVVYVKELENIYTIITSYYL